MQKIYDSESPSAEWGSRERGILGKDHYKLTTAVWFFCCVSRNHLCCQVARHEVFLLDYLGSQQNERISADLQVITGSKGL